MEENAGPQKKGKLLPEGKGQNIMKNNYFQLQFSTTYCCR